jgi:hypothetical protein
MKRFCKLFKRKTSQSTRDVESPGTERLPTTTPPTGAVACGAVSASKYVREPALKEREPCSTSPPGARGDLGSTGGTKMSPSKTGPTSPSVSHGVDSNPNHRDTSPGVSRPTTSPRRISRQERRRKERERIKRKRKREWVRGRG